jgi:peptidyl-prolyl cis-trans isomerase D
VVVIGASLILFVASDFFGRGRGQRRQQKEYYEIGTIGKNSVSYPEYETRVQDVLEIYKLSGQNVDEATNNQVREQIWQQMIRETILDSKFEKLGISVSNEELDELVLGNNPHIIVQQLFTDQQTGFFNKSFLVNFLKQTEIDETAKRYWLFFENEIIIDRLSSKFNSFVSKGLYTTSKQAEFEKMLMANTVDFSYVMKNYSSVPDADITITDSEVKAYFEKHKENYKRTAQRDIEYVIFDVTPSEDDIQETEKWINKTKEDFGHSTEPVQFINITSDVRHTDFFYPFGNVPDTLKDFVRKEDLNSVFGPYLENGSYKIARLLAVEERPDSVHVRHILMSPNQFMPLEGVRHIADSLAQVLRGNRASFNEFAMMFSEDSGSAQIGGDLGWFPEGVMVTPFNNACFTGRRGEIKTVETAFGVHIIEILDVSRRTKKYDIGFVERRIIASSQTNQRVYSEANQFASSSDTYEKFNNAISERQLNKRIANNVTPQQRTLPGIDNPRPLITALFQTKKDKIILDNNQQAIFELGDSYVVAFCSKVQEDGYATVKDVDFEIRVALMKDKKAGIISDEFKSNMTADRNLDAIASSLNLYVQDASQVNFRSYVIEGVGIEPALAATVPAAAQNVVSGPVKGENGVFLFTVNSSTPSAEEDIDAIQQRLASMAQFRGSYEVFEALRKDAKIVDKRYKFY